MNKKNRIIYSYLIFIFLLSTGSCETPITPQLNQDDSKPLLVVEGQITDQEGPFTVKLTTTVPVSDFYNPKPVLNADVRIIDDKGTLYQLYGDDKGLYETAEKNLKGIPGNIYTLYLTNLEDGTEYTSTPVQMQDVPDIDSVYFEEVTYTRITEGQVYEDNWLNILMDTHDAEGNNKYWRWEFEETWEVNMVADKVKVNHSLDSPEYISWMYISQIDDKKICWVTKPSASISVASTAKNSADEFNSLYLEKQLRKFTEENGLKAAAIIHPL